MYATVSLSQTPQHRIGVRTRIDGRGEFYVIATGHSFVPRGSNLIRVADQVKPTGEATNTHSTFAPGFYDPAGAEAALSGMETRGYNYVRVFITGITTTSVSTASGINTAYVANLVDFLTRAKVHSIQVLISLDEWLPYTYGAILGKATNPLASGVNAYYLSTGGIQAHTAFFSDFVSELARQKAPMDTLFGYTLRNEQSFDNTQMPMTLTTGAFNAPNGHAYDLSHADQSLALLQDGLNYFIDQVRSAILGKDPGALVGIGFFAPQGPNPYRIGDTRFVTSAAAISSSTADFIDLHPYPDLSLAQYAQNFGIPATSRKPLLMGEFGITVQQPGVGAERVADSLQQWQVDSCEFGFTGWGLWTWDGPPGYWTVTPVGGPVDTALSPVSRPDPCVAGPLQDLAPGATVIASNTWTGSSPGSGGPALAVDGSVYTFWNSGALPPQWIELQLPHPSVVRGMRLMVDQSPTGQTVHRVYVKTHNGQFFLVTEFNGVTQDFQVLTWTPQTPLFGIEAIQVQTVTSPSWVGWREIEILSADPGRVPAVTSVNTAYAGSEIAQNTWIEIKGKNLVPSVTPADGFFWSNAPDFAAGKMPSQLGGVSVTVNGKPAYIWFFCSAVTDPSCAADQINALTPLDGSLGRVQVGVTNQGNVGAPLVVDMRSVAPSFLRAGATNYVLATHADYTLVGPTSLYPGFSTPAKPGETIILYAIGLGLPTATLVDGSAIQSGVLPQQPAVQIGGAQATVVFAGLVSPGLYQVNVTIPGTAANGDNAIIASYSGSTTLTGDLIAVQR